MQQDRRKQKETKDRLGSIQDRISRALSRYDLGNISRTFGSIFRFFCTRKLCCASVLRFSRKKHVGRKINLLSKLRSELFELYEAR